MSLPSPPTCCYCGTTTRELRPYGPAGQMCCAPCATSTPERREVFEQRMDEEYNAAKKRSPSRQVVLIPGKGLFTLEEFLSGEHGTTAESADPRAAEVIRKTLHKPSGKA